MREGEREGDRVGGIITGRRDAEGGKVEIGGKALTRKEEKAHTAGTRQTRHAAATETDRKRERQTDRDQEDRCALYHEGKAKVAATIMDYRK